MTRVSLWAWIKESVRYRWHGWRDRGAGKRRVDGVDMMDPPSREASAGKQDEEDGE